MLSPERSLCMLNRAIEWCTREERGIQESIDHCRQLLQPRRKETQEISKEDSKPVAKEEPGPLPEERQEVELLERVLEKALRIRSTALIEDPAVLGKGSHEKDWGATDCTSYRDTQRATKTKICSGVPQESRKTAATKAGPQRLLGTETKGAKHPATRSARTQQEAGESSLKGAPVSRKVKQPSAASGKRQQYGPSSAPVSSFQQESVRNRERSEEKRDAASGGEERRAFSLREDGNTLQLPLGWRKQCLKHSRLWDKVSLSQTNPGVERTRFIERLQSSFHSELPACSPADVGDEILKLQGSCSALRRGFVNEQQAQRTASASWERDYESMLTIEALQETVSKLLYQTKELKEAVEAWEDVFPGGCCSPGTGSLRGKTISDTPVLRYSGVQELKELEMLKHSVNVLQQQIEIHKVMSEELTPWFPPMLSSGCPDPALTRGLYSLLGEGGQQFPALVLDNVPD
ncbi:tubulin epsilon and delta complex protein 2-like [Polyodon spathula]|uniref:tubulin epsilon and delta complex protein 2-like n=1 Tax=Polyodon spathula TaxID=7913 RepID=UPI001B7E7471|nr:tubulin epsilon and delta complex protein 2-like [Polyodon spathula]